MHTANNQESKMVHEVQELKAKIIRLEGELNAGRNAKVRRKTDCTTGNDQANAVEIVVQAGPPEFDLQIKVIGVKHNDSVLAVSLNADGNLLATGTKDNEAHVTDLVSGKNLRIIKHNG